MLIHNIENYNMYKHNLKFKGFISLPYLEYKSFATNFIKNSQNQTLIIVKDTTMAISSFDYI